MKISAKGWLLFIVVAAFCLALAYGFWHPLLSFVDLSVARGEAVSKAEHYLRSSGQDPKAYLRAAVFTSDDWPDRYLQKTLGLRQEEEFIRRHGYDMFSWKVRFFKELQKEEYSVRISSRTGEVIGFAHLIEDTEARQDLGKEVARQKAQEFLRNKFRIDFKEYDFHAEQAQKFDKRIDYSFSWEKKGVYIPWRKGEGGAKLLIGATVCGGEISQFYKSSLDIPEKFQRYIQKQLSLGDYLFSISFLLFMAWVAWAIFLIVKRKSQFIVRVTKGWFVSLAVFLMAMNLTSALNNLQAVFMGYSTSVPMANFIGIFLINFFISLIYLGMIFVMPGLAGESLRSEVLPENKFSSFLHYLRSTFYSRSVAGSILFGYLVFIIALGLQAAMFYLGQRFLGVWRESVRLTYFSSAYLPVLSVFVVAASASLSEETIFRLFGISWAKKYLRSTAIAVIMSALLWGFSHSNYAIFPVWFRGIEVSLLGILYGVIFLRFGIIPVLVAHYLFDIFWGGADYLTGKAPVYLFAGCLFIFLLPLVFALVAYLANRQDKEMAPEMILNRTEKYNLEVLTAFVSAKKSQGLSEDEIRQGLIKHNWDIILVRLALEKVFGPH
jgi:hypothetical protein